MYLELLWLDRIRRTPSHHRLWQNVSQLASRGIVYCYNVKDGKLSWTYAAVRPVHGNLVVTITGGNDQLFITDGKIYSGHTEHSVNQPHAARCTIPLPQRHNRRGNMASKRFVPSNPLGRTRQLSATA